MADRYLTIHEAAILKGVAPAEIHEAICNGNLPTIVQYRGGSVEPRLVGRWELEVWAPGQDADGGGTRPFRRTAPFTVLPPQDRTPSDSRPVLS